MADQQLAIEIKLEDGTFRRAFANLESDSKRSGKNIGDNLGHPMMAMASKVTAAIGGIISVASVYKGIKDAIGSEQSIQQLNMALAQTGQYSKKASADLQEFIGGLEKTTAVSDDVIASGAAMLVSMGKLSGEGLKGATKAALDLSAGMNGLIGPDQAFTLLAKAADGNTEALGRYGIKIRETGDKSADFAAVMAKINAQFGGFAEGRLNTFGGVIEKIGVSFDNFLKEVGFAFTRSTILKELIKNVSGYLDMLTGSLDKLGKSGNVLDALFLKSLEFGKVLAEYVLPVAELLYRTFKFVWDAIIGGFQTVIALWATEAATLVGVLSKVIPGLEGMKASLDTFAQSSADVMKDAAYQTMDSFDQIGNYDFTAKSVAMLDSWNNTAQQIVATHKNATDQIKNQQNELASPTFTDMFIAEWKRANNNVQQIAAQMATTLRGGLVNGVANGFAAMGKAWQEGTSVLDALGKALLQTLGQVLIQLGTQVITVGLLMQSVPILFGLQGWAAVAAGAGMIVAGGVLTAAAGAGAGGGSGGAGAPTGLGPGGGVAVSPLGGGLADQTLGLSETSAEPQSRVVVNIQGNVLDRRGTGLEIAEIIRENFELSGVTVGATG